MYRFLSETSNVERMRKEFIVMTTRTIRTRAIRIASKVYPLSNTNKKSTSNIVEIANCISQYFIVSQKFSLYALKYIFTTKIFFSSARFLIVKNKAVILGPDAIKIKKKRKIDEILNGIYSCPTKKIRFMTKNNILLIRK